MADDGAHGPVAVLGGGQLGRMLGLAGIPLGLSFRFLDPLAGAPGAAVGELVVGALDDHAALAATIDGAAVATYEWEGVPADGARFVARTCPIRPSPAALEVSQDRLEEKTLCRALGLATPSFEAVDDRPGLERALTHVGLPAVLKTRRGGYDGKGQRVLKRDGDADVAFDELGGVPLLLEAYVPFDRELSVLAVRALDGTTACWPLVENVHRDGILCQSRAPAPGTTVTVEQTAASYATRLLDELDYVGVLAIELFDAQGALLVNEIAPRVHNSGHWTIEGAMTSQFENHLRAIVGWPLGSTAPVGASATLNCIGALPDRAAVLRIPGAHFHDYGKAVRPGRKLGHVTLTAPSPDRLDEHVEQVAALLETAGT